LNAVSTSRKDPESLLFGRIISMDKTTAIRHVKQYADVVRQNFNVKKVILYGSYSRGSARKDSDIDVAVVLSRIDEDFLMAEAKLFRLRREIDTRIEPQKRIFRRDFKNRGSYL
jgi:predicted nucleotidyltransferase